MVCFTGLWGIYFGLQRSVEQEYLNIKTKHQIIIDSLDFKIDSLLREIDTLQQKNEIRDFNILDALIYVESSNNDSAYNSYEDAVGCLQIRKTMVNDINRILLRQKSDLRFSYDDRWLRNKSIKMFDIYCKHYGLTTAEEIARCWNGGPRGMNNPLTADYWRKVQKDLTS